MPKNCVRCRGRGWVSLPLHEQGLAETDNVYDWAGWPNDTDFAKRPCPVCTAKTE